MSVLNLISLLGCVTLVGLAWLAGGCRRPLPVRTIAGASSLLLVLAVAIFWVPWTRPALVLVNDLAFAVIRSAASGAEFLFGPLALGPGQATANGEASIGFVLATQVLPAVVFFAGLMALLYHWGAIQPLVRLLGRSVHRILGISGAEALAGSANLFFGVESAASIRPYLTRMTRSELLTVLTCCMSTVASTTLAIYVLFLGDLFPHLAGHLISASLLSIPAAVLVSKLMLPERDQPETSGSVPRLGDPARHGNSMSALAAGAWDGLRLAAGISTLLIAVLGLLSLLDVALGFATRPWHEALGGPVDLGRILGVAFTPLAWLLGIETADVAEAARILGRRLVLTEVVGYRDLAALAAEGAVSSRTLLVLSYALCGFAHFASVGIFVGGFSALAPERRDDLAGLGPRALVAATLATLITGAVAGAFYHGKGSLLGL